ncbi:SepM family pheromone-processing serine protease [Ectobacillus ponti]|uniref:endopeptidase La n=1 Tax=Ectobacillus ponti TaxID=2961894 RepID=A0AA41XDT3_9BACI|nr:SepM family pheromone-processing serine protease [Ectobacillus ponti]MCP8970261.1 PDZ domain-containing protein [Ectobacillus ponti]
MLKRMRYLYVFLIGALVAFGITYIPLPYYITKPGLAEKLSPYVQVEGGEKEKGDFMLVTVSMSRANVISYAVAKLSKYQEIYQQDQIMQKGESDKEYQFRQTHMMDESQNAAIYNAYTRAGKKVSYENKGVYVVFVSQGMPAEKVFKPGDLLRSVDGKPLQTADEFIAYMKTKKLGDQVAIEYERNKDKKQAAVPLKQLKDQPEGRAGIGVQIVTDSELQVEPKVKIDAHQIGGPSAGMMFTLEIYNQLTPGDLTKGHEIAGTGTIDEKGTIGPIGGISQKIVAASEAGAEIFFAPNEGGKAGSNYKDAVKTAKDIGTKMKIVPVDTWDDALHYLEKLPGK